MWTHRRTLPINAYTASLAPLLIALLLVAVPRVAIGGPCNMTCAEFCNARFDGCSAGGKLDAKGQLTECLGFAKAIPSYCKSEKELFFAECLENCPEELDVEACRLDVRLELEQCKLDAQAEREFCKLDFESNKLDNEDSCQGALAECLAGCS